jgi:hypothetical protein
MITIFCDFPTIFCEYIGVFLKNQCNDQIFAQSSFALSKKRQFLPFFGENIFKIITSVPGRWTSTAGGSWPEGGTGKSGSGACPTFSIRKNRMLTAPEGASGFIQGC